MLGLIVISIVTRKEIVWTHGPFSLTFWNMSTMTRWTFTEGQTFQNVFEELQAGDGIQEILAFSDNSILIAIATAERFRD